MSLLRDIQQDLASAAVDTATILRKCKILAARLKSDQFADWVECELNGYPESMPLPDYRRLTVVHYGTFANMAWQYEKSAIPLRIIPEEHREAFTCIPFLDGIAKAEALAETKNTIRIEKPDLVPIIDAMAQSMNCLAVWAEIPANEFHQLLSAVKNRILDFALRLETENPDAGEAPPGVAPIAPEKLRPLIQNIIYGSIGAIAQNSHDFTQNASMSVSTREIEKLAEELATHLSELDLPQRQKQRIEAQLAILKAESKGEPDPTIVREAAHSIRNLAEGAIAGLIASAAQPTIWTWIHQILGHLSK